MASLRRSALRLRRGRRGAGSHHQSNFLVTAVSPEPGTATLVADRDTAKRELDDKTRNSTDFAVLVLRDEDKPEASKFFRTPLIFSVHEAKGLEYQNIVLYRFISGHRQEYREIAEGIRPEDLEVAELEYRRAADKADKSLEVFNFYVNALYVAMTRAVKNLYLIESDTSHPLLQLLGLALGTGTLQVESKASSLQDWQREARKLELQGKLEQAEAIRKNVLRQSPVPWPVLGRAKVHEALVKTFQEQVPTPKFRHQLFDYAACYGLTTLAAYLWRCTGYKPAADIREQFPVMRRKSFGRYESNQFKDILRECDRHGVDHRTPMNLTPLITAAASGNVAMVDALLERGADIEACDTFGCNALYWVLGRAFAEPAFASGVFAGLYERLAPPAVDVKVGDRLVRIDRHLSEYFLFQAMWALFKRRFSATGWSELAAFSADVLLAAYEHLPLGVLREQRRKRAFLSAVLSRNEVDREHAYNRQLFLRLRQGWYQFNPNLSVRVRRPDGEAWTPIYVALDLPLIKEVCEPRNWSTVDFLLIKDRYEPTGVPMAGKILLERQKTS